MDQARCVGQALGMIARRCGDHPTFQVFRALLGQIVVGSANFEGPGVLQVFAFEKKRGP